MMAQEILEKQWSIMIVPQLTGKVQLAYAATNATKAACRLTGHEGNHPAEVRHQLRGVPRFQVSKGSGTTRSSSRRHPKGWWSDFVKVACETVEDAMDAIVLEQLPSTRPEDVRIWVSERKPTSSVQVGQLAKEYLQARKLTQAMGKSEAPKRVDKRAAGGHRSYFSGEMGHF